MKHVKFLSVFILFLTILSNCGIENFQSTSELKPPSGLTASSSNRSIYLQFYGYNNEDEFSGYDVFIGYDDQAVKDQKIRLKNESTYEYPFINLSPTNSLRTINLTITKDSNGNDLQTGHQFHIGVAAYDFKNKTNSLTSNITNIVIQE